MRIGFGRAALSAAACLSMVAGARAQWSADPSVNLTLSDRAGEQNQAKIRARADGGCWVSWYDNADGGYDVYLQRLNAAGEEQFQHNGLVLRDLGFSSTQDYDLKVDSQGNAIVAFRDDRAVPGTTQITVMKIGPLGERLWGATGVVASGGAAGTDRNNPKCAVVPGDVVVVGWGGGSPSAISLRAVSADGTLVGAAPTVFPDLAATVRPIQMSDMQASGDGVIVLGVRCSGANCVTSNKHLYAQKYAVSESAFSALWDRNTGNAIPGEHVIVFDGTSIQTGTFPSFVPDGAGGGAFGWYENGGQRRAYVQRVDADGVEQFAHNGVAVLEATGVLSLSAGFDYDVATGEFFMAVKTSNANQTMWDVRAAKVDAGGNREWASEGVVLSPLVNVQSNFERAVRDELGGMTAVWIENAGAPSRIRAMAVNIDAEFPWGPDPIDVCSVSSGKARLDATRGMLGNTLAVWGDARADVNNIVAQSIRPDGALGPPGPIDPVCPADFNGDGTADPDDLADYIACYFTPPCGQADFNGDGNTDPDDLSDYIAAYFGGGC